MVDGPMKPLLPTLAKLISEFRPEKMILTSYTLDLVTFERLILPHCNDAQICIVVDKAGYQSATMLGPAVREAGIRYRVFQSNSPNYVFHPKVTVLSKAKEVRLIVSSGNLSHTGICNNLEVIDWVDFNLDKDESISRDIFSFLSALEKMLAGKRG